MNQKIKQMGKLILAVVFVAAFAQTESKAEIIQVSGCRYTANPLDGCSWGSYNVVSCTGDITGSNCGVRSEELLPPQ
ncbi:MAG: hypothetical protein Q8L07_01575 [Sediminibacterium sp.]|nr:hypothetical protein [Sediminibacterium sp.]MDP1811926.1 hypothetical protein [Sediminibacterium sp.]